MGRVAWNFQMASWQIRYEDANGGVHTSRTGLRPRAGPGAYETSREELYVAAERMWNELGKSQADRFEMDARSRPLSLPAPLEPPCIEDRAEPPSAEDRVDEGSGGA